MVPVGRFLTTLQCRALRIEVGMEPPGLACIKNTHDVPGVAA